MTLTKLYLIDGDEFLYRAASACEYELEIDDVTYLMSKKEEVYETFNTSLNQYLGSDTNSIVCYSDRTNFRYDCYPEYKGGRAKTRKPIAYYAVRDRLIEEYEARLIPHLEADDVMSIIATNPKYVNQYDEIHIISQDKDMQQVPNVYLNEASNPTDPNEAELWRYTQAIAGDRTDGYPGLPKYGVVTAAKYLAKFKPEEYLDAVVQLYLDKGLPESYAYSQVNCACILRYGEYDFKNNQPILKGK